MELNGEQLIAAPIPDVWKGLNDIDVLAKSIPGCEEISRISPEEIHAKVMFKIGPVRARFAGKLLLSDVIPINPVQWHLRGLVVLQDLQKGAHGWN